jgi:hypothetical protein
MVVYHAAPTLQAKAAAMSCICFHILCGNLFSVGKQVVAGSSILSRLLQSSHAFVVWHHEFPAMRLLLSISMTRQQYLRR